MHLSLFPLLIQPCSYRQPVYSHNQKADTAVCHDEDKGFHRMDRHSQFPHGRPCGHKYHRQRDKYSEKFKIVCSYDLGFDLIHKYIPPF